MAKILIVDDDPRNRRVLQAVLGQTGHEVLTAESGAEGIEVVHAHAPDLVLMDVLMPGMDGMETLRRLRGEPRFAALKVVAVTGLSMQSDAERILAAGFDGYLGKPIRYREIIAELKRLLGTGSRA